MSPSSILLFIGVAIGIAAMLAACVRRGGLRWRIGAAGALLTALSIVFLLTGGTPLLSPGGRVTSHGALDQLIAGLWWLLAASGLSFVVQYTLGHDGRSRQSRLMSDLLSAGIYLGALLAVMSFVLKLPLSGLVATSGIVAVVLGLALQSTLADLFSGIAVGVEQPFRLGDSISLGDGIEGSVSQINWRSIRISTDDDDVAIVPNSAVAKARIVNRSFPTSRRGAGFEITTGVSADPERVRDLIAQALLLTPAVLERPAPSINLVRLGMKTSTHKVHFFVDSPKQLGQAKSVALRHVRTLLLQAGMLELPGNAHPTDQANPLSSMQLFESLTAEQLDCLSGTFTAREMAVGDALFQQGDFDTNLYIVADGVLEVSRRGDDGALEIGGRIGPGDYIGEIGLVTGASKEVSAVAKTRTVVQILTKETLEPLLKSSPALAQAFEASVKRGYVLLERGRIARPAADARGITDFLPRLRAFFHPATVAAAGVERQTLDG